MMRELRAEVRRLRQQVRRMERRSPVRPGLVPWCEKYLSAYFYRGASRFHRWLTAELDTLHERRGSRLDVIAPRGSAKSTWSSFAYPLYCAVHGLEPYIQIVSDTTAQAWIWLEGIRKELQDNEDLARDYPHVSMPGDVWRQERLRLRNGVVIEALGTGSRIRGRRNRAERPSLIIVDDPQNEDHITSAALREKSWRWFTKALMNAGTPGTNILVLGTTLHRDCLVLRLKRTAGWRARVFRAIVAWPQRMDLWQQWEAIFHDYESDNHEQEALAFYMEHKASMDAGAEVLWGELEDLYSLMCLRATIGPAAFASEKQSDPVNPEQCEWGPEYFDYPGFWFERWPEGLQIRTLALDPSKGTDARTGDYSAYVRYGRDLAGYEYCEADLQRRAMPQIVADGVEHARQWQPEAFGIEVNQFQELFRADFERVAALENVRMPIYGINNATNKLVRIRRLGPALAQKRLRFKARSPGTALLVQQLRDFPVADHDDGPDALEMATRLAVEIVNGPAGGSI
jgi:predicted phage terminase large subunit-like protein